MLSLGRTRNLAIHLSQATFITEVEILKQELMESEVVVEGEYVSRKVLLEEWGWSQCLACLHALALQFFRSRVDAVIKFCRTNPAKFMRSG